MLIFRRRCETPAGAAGQVKRRGGSLSTMESEHPPGGKVNRAKEKSSELKL
jgi:hypothetical protein